MEVPDGFEPSIRELQSRGLNHFLTEPGEVVAYPHKVSWFRENLKTSETIIRI